MLSLDDQQDVPRDQKRGYHLIATATLPLEEHWWEKPIGQWGDNKDRLLQAAKDGFEALEKTRAVGNAEGKITFVKEHASLLADPNVFSRYMFGDTGASNEVWRIDQSDSNLVSEQPSENDTMFSEAYLQQWNMAFLIRHPAMAFPSLYRILVVEKKIHQGSQGSQDSEESRKSTENTLRISMTLRWSRRLYDLAAKIARGANDAAKASETATWPIVLDADDVMANPAVVQKYAALMGMDPTKVQSTWSPVTEEEREKMTKRAQRMLSTLNASNGIMADKSSANIDVAAETEKWRKEFGDEGAEKLETWVRAAMPDYEYLRERRLRV
jgi:hypothetical protein